MIVTTTSNLDEIRIKEYLQPISAHVVVGMNLFKDFLAGLTDTFGGKSSTYEKTLESINEEVIYKLEKKALAIGANCILGLKIDNSEVSAQGKSMLMVTAVGTAAVADINEDLSKSIRHNKNVATNNDDLTESLFKDD
ncbi:heavy metal-binding domain-containing protein [uncultured Draconibacterium sp.]|uniref:YbjQ family protein n=1 Tax=uncultured Draconibacterium sp. TaxID=1573823 RepID=UPI0029C8D024|nr:heavy metal-binding domain-containing protein [uncultured Draconibacterium sp.]